jgi:hypothetical protein
MAIAFWVLMLLWLVLGVITSWPNKAAVGNSVLLFLLFGLLGWKVFGPALHG